MSIADRLASVGADLIAADPRVERGRMLRSPGLKAAGRFFAFATPTDLVVKLPGPRVQELIRGGAGRPCALGSRAPMREWVRLAPDSDEAVATYLAEARDFITHPPRR